ncbi:MAG: PH domain-containing protein [Myxococcota bacterium]
MPNSPQAPRAHAPAGATGHQQPETIYEGLGKHSAHAGAYARWILVLIAGVAVGIGLMQIEFFSKWPLWLLGLASLPGLFLVFLRHRTTRFKITARRVEYERGILNREVDGLELWRVLDVRYNQTLADRLTGNGRITLIGTDKSDPELLLYGLPEHRQLFERLQDAVQVARQMGRPMELVGQDGHMEEMGGMGLHQ